MFQSDSTLYLTFIFASICVLVKWLSTRKKLPPGPTGLPIFGYSPLIKGDPSVAFTKLAKKYGPIFSINIGGDVTLVLNDYETMKEVYEHPHVLSRPSNVFAAMPFLGFGTMNGPAWNEQRKFCLQATKDARLGRKFWENMIYEELQIFLDYIGESGGASLDIGDRLLSESSNIILSLLIGRRFDRIHEKEKLELAKKFSYLSFADIKVDETLTHSELYRKTLAFLGFKKGELKNTVVYDFANMIAQEIDKSRKQTDVDSEENFMHTYLKKLDQVSTQNKKHFFSVDNLLGNIVLLFIGGSSTTTITLKWLLRLMAVHPEIQEKVWNELKDVIGTNGKMAFEKRSQCPYTMAVITEAIRFSSIVPIASTRMASQNIEVRGYIIPKGMHVIANLRAILYDPKCWKDPHEFNPNRFLTDDGKKVLKTSNGYVPFSHGRRNCPGETIAWTEILIFFSAIIQKFSISCPPDDEVKFETVKGLVYDLKPQNLCFTERSPTI